MPSWEPLAGRSGCTGAVEVEGKSRKDKNKSEKVHGRMRAFGNNNERSQRSGAKRNGRADADQVKHRISVATFQNDEQGNCCPSGTVTRGRRTAAGC